jgi:ubiquinone/menaquinone biosynthesis C-methylase UbiE
MKKTQRIFWNAHYRDHGSAWRKANYFTENFEGKSVLELGCGNGKSIFGIIEKKPSRVVAVDFSEIALRIAKQNFLDFSNSIEFVHAECTDLPFKQNEFDFVIANHVVGAMTEIEREKCSSEIFRVLNESGKLIFLDFSIGDLREKGTLIEKNTYQKKNGIIQHFFTEKEVMSLFAKFSKQKIKTTSNYLLLNKKKVLRSEITGEFTK